MEPKTCFFVVLYFWGETSLQNVVLDPLKNSGFWVIALICHIDPRCIIKFQVTQGEHRITDMPQMAKRVSQLSDIDHPAPPPQTI